MEVIPSQHGSQIDIHSLSSDSVAAVIVENGISPSCTSAGIASTVNAMIDYYHDKQDELSNLISIQQFVDRYDSLPSNVNVVDLLGEISSVLSDSAVGPDRKQAAARLLYEILPKVEEDLDEIVRVSNVLPALIDNVGNSIAAVRKTSLDALIAYVKCSSQPERVLRFVITDGIDSGSSSSASIVHCIRSIPMILDAVKTYGNSSTTNKGGSDGVSHSAMVYVVTTLSKRMVQITHQEDVVRTLYEVKRVVGESKFDHFLETYYPQVKRDFDMFCEVYNIYDSTSTTESIVRNADESSDDDDLRPIEDKQSSASDEFNLPEEKQPNDMASIEMTSFNNDEQREEAEVINSSDDDVIMKIYDEDGNEIRRTSSRRRVTFGGEVVKIRTPDSDASRSITTGLVGGCIRDKVDITANIVIQISNDRNNPRRKIDSTDDDDKFKMEEKARLSRRKSRSSHIPLPIKPALNRPKDRRQLQRTVVVGTFRQPSTTSLDRSSVDKRTLGRYTEYEELSEIPNYDGDSFTTTSSSSDSNDQHYNNINKNINNKIGGRAWPESDDSGSPSSYSRYYYANKENVLINNTLIDVTKLGIDDSVVLENLFRKDDWHSYTRGLDRLAVTLRQPEVIQNLSSNKDTSVGVSLLCYLMNSLLETKASQRVTISSLRALKGLCSGLQTNILFPYLVSLVPIICKYLSPSYADAVRLEATEMMKILMQNLTPSSIINILFTEQCFFSKSSKMRENSLLCLMYALMTFPSTEFDRVDLTQVIIKHAIKEPKRRVRQAILDALSILAQFLSKSQFKVEGNIDEDTIAFRNALRARLNRRQLPVISADGLILYAYQVSPSTPFGNDVEWILNGRGSLSLNCCKSQAPISYITEDTTLLPSKYSNWITQSNNKIAINGSANTLHYPIIKYSDNEDNYPFIEKDYSINFNKDYVDNAEYMDQTFQYSSTYGFPRLNASYEPVTKKITEDKEESDISYHAKSRLPVRRVNNEYKSPTRQKSQDFKISFPTLTSSPKKKITDQINHYIREQGSPQRIIQNGKALFQSYQSPDRYRNYEKNSEIAKKSSTLLTEASTSNQCIIKLDEDFVESNKIDENVNAFVLVPVISNEINSMTILEENDDVTISEKLDENKMQNTGSNEQQLAIKSNKYLERKKLKRSLTKEIKMPKNSLFINPEELPPFESPKDGLHKTLQQMENSDWESVIQGLQGVVILSKHHSKQLTPTLLHTCVTAVSKHVRSLRSQVARVACLSALSIFKYINRIPDQDIEEMASALFSRTSDTNKFIREDSSKALDAMFDNVRLTKCVINILQRLSGHPNASVRSSASRLLLRLIKLHGATEVISLTKDNRDVLLKTAANFLTDANLETRNHAKEVFSVLAKDKRMLVILSEIMPGNVMNIINKCVSRIARPKC